MSDGFTTEGKAFVPHSTYRNLHATAGDVVVNMIAEGTLSMVVSQPHVVDDLLDIRNAKPWLKDTIDGQLAEITWLNVVKGERVVEMARALLVFMGEPTNAG